MRRVRFGWSGAAAALAFAGLLGVSTSSRAGYEIIVTEGAGPAITITDGGSLDADGVVNGAINVNTDGLNSLLTDFKFNTLGGTSNALVGGSNTIANLTQNGDVVRTDASGAAATISIVAQEDNFLFPTGNPKTMRTAASDTFTNTTAGDSRTFQSTFDASGAGGGVVNSPLFAFVPPVGPGPFGTSNPGTDTPLGVQPIPYVLSNTTVITLGGNVDPNTPQRDQFTGGTSVRAVPEPGSLALMLLGVPALALGRRLRRSA